MLVPVRISGSKPPLFFVHDQYGIMPFGRSFAQVSGPDQPFYVINANGIDGRSPVIHDVQAMVLAYIAEIHGARPMGPLLIGGLGSGGLLAIEIARELQERGRQIGPVILADPPRPAGPVQESRAIDSRWPAIGGHFYHPVRTALLAQASRSDSDLPFDSGDPKQLHLATLAGVATLVAFTKYAPKPFSGAAELLLPVERPEEFFDTHGPWHELLDGECIVHVLPWNHDELLRSGRQTVLYTLKFLVEEAIEAIAPGEAIDAPASGRSWFASDKPHAGANRNPNSVLVVNENWDLHWRDPPYLPRWFVHGPHELIRTTVESRLLPRGCSVLEIGCGAGQQAAWLSQAGFRVLGIDISPEAIRRARVNFTAADGPVFAVADAAGPDALHRTFDAIIDSGCFHVIQPDQHARYLANVLSWSRAGTHFLLMVHCVDRSPVDRLEQLRELLASSFEMIEWEARAGCLPRDPLITMMILRLVRRDSPSEQRDSPAQSRILDDQTSRNEMRVSD